MFWSRLSRVTVLADVDMPSQKKCVSSRYVSHQEIIANIKTMRLHVHNKVTCRTHVNGRSLRGLSNHAPGHLMAGHFRVTSQFCMGGSLMKNHNILFQANFKTFFSE